MTQIFRITHIENLPFILRNGLHAPNASVSNPEFKSIGFPTLIDYRRQREVPVAPGGTLADYVPFYFWVKSPMLYVIQKGNDAEVIPTAAENIIYLVSSTETLVEHGIGFVFTDRHALLDYANFFHSPADIEKLNWAMIKTDQWGRHFGSERMELKQAECLVYSHLPVKSINGIAVYNETAYTRVVQYLSNAGKSIEVKIKPTFYF